MSEATKSTATPAAEKKSKDRSPGYAGISLRRALELAQKFWDTDKRQAVLSGRAATNLGFSAKSSAGMIALAAMKKYGLLEEEGSGEFRKVKLTEPGVALLNPSASNRADLLKQAALGPKIHADLWAKYKNEASKGTIHDYLVFERHFNEEAARIVISSYFDTIDFAKLTPGDTVTANEDNGGDEEGEQQEAAATGNNESKSPPNPAPLGSRKAVPPQPMISNPPAGLIDFPVPLPSGSVAYFRLPPSITEGDFQFYKSLLDALKTGLVKPADKTADQHKD